MKTVILNLGFALILLIIVNCGSVPPTFYYRIDYTMQEPSTQNNNISPYTLGISQFTADILYENDKIVYRRSPYEVQFYHYRRWVAPPKKIVTEKLLKQFRASGEFQRVVSIPSTFKIDYILKGRIQAFEEWDESSAWYGIVALEFQLQNPETKEILWEKMISEKTPAAKKEPVEVVKAISESLNKVVKKSIEEIKKKLKYSRNI
ncbi:MAG: ABC-type transport auxiliary lipoprotein family protein [bacterium]